MLSLKKSIIGKHDEILTSYDTASQNDISYGTVVFFTENGRGALVEFFNNVQGYLPKREISEDVSSTDDIKKFIRLGQTVKSRILSVNPKQQKLYLSLRTNVLDTEMSDELDSYLKSVQIGRSLINGEISEITKNSVVINIEGTKGVRALLNVNHISDDSLDVRNSKFKKLTMGQYLKDILVLGSKDSFVLATWKKSLIEAAQNDRLLRDENSVSIGKVAKGFIKQINNKLGLFIEFSNGLVGLAFKSELFPNGTRINYNEEDLNKHFKLYQTVDCKVVSTNEENGQFNLSLKDFNTDGIVSLVDKKGELKIGNTIDAKIKRITYNQISLEFISSSGSDLSGLRARLDVSNIYDSMVEIENPKAPLQGKFTKGDTIKVKVIENTYSDKTKSVSFPAFDVSVKPSALSKKGKVKLLDSETIEIGQEFLAFVNNLDFKSGNAFVNISHSISGTIPFESLTDNIDFLNDEDLLTNEFPLGSALSVKVRSISDDLKITLAATKQIQQIDTGDVLVGRIIRQVKFGFVIRLNTGASGFLSVFDTFDNYDDIASWENNDNFLVGNFVKVKVLEIDNANEKLYLTARPSSIDNSSNNIVKDKHLISQEDLVQGDIVRGIVDRITDSGLFIRLSRHLMGRVMIKDLSDFFVQDWKSLYNLGQLVTARVLSSSSDGRKIDLGLKESLIKDTGKFRSLSDITVGESISGQISKIADYGVFIQLDGFNNVSGLCHRSEISDNTMAIHDLNKLFTVGDKVKTKVLKFDSKTNKLALGMKASYFDNEDIDEDMGEYENSLEKLSDSESEAMELDIDNVNDSDDSSESDDSDGDSDASDDNSKGLSASFDWSTSILDNGVQDTSSDDDSDQEESGRPRRKKQKRDTVLDSLKANAAPSSSADFEKLLLSHPSSPLVYISFISHHLSLSSPDAARALARRALSAMKTESDKLDIWSAWFNLEIRFGSPEQAQLVFDTAVKEMDPQQIWARWINAWKAASQPDRVIEEFEKMVKKYHPSSNGFSGVLEYAKFLYETKKTESARGLMKRYENLMKKDTVLRFAILEYSLGDPERGRSLMEVVLTSGRRRVDWWNVYVDMEVKHGATNMVEDLFERILSDSKDSNVSRPKLSMKNTKFFYKKWLRYETERSDFKNEKERESRMDYIKAKAREFVKHKEQSTNIED